MVLKYYVYGILRYYNMWCFFIELKLKFKLLKYVANTFEKIIFTVKFWCKKKLKGKHNIKILGVAETEYYNIYTV